MLIVWHAIVYFNWVLFCTSVICSEESALTRPFPCGAPIVVPPGKWDWLEASAFGLRAADLPRIWFPKGPPFAEFFTVKNEVLVGSYQKVVILQESHYHEASGKNNKTSSVFFFARAAFFSYVPKIPELFRPNRVKQRVFIWGGDSGEWSRREPQDALRSGFRDVAESLMSSRNQYASPVLFKPPLHLYCDKIVASGSKSWSRSGSSVPVWGSSLGLPDPLPSASRGHSQLHPPPHGSSSTLSARCGPDACSPCCQPSDECVHPLACVAKSPGCVSATCWTYEALPSSNVAIIPQWFMCP